MISVTWLRAILESYKTGYCCCPSLYGDLIKAKVVSMHRSLMSMRLIAAVCPACGQPASADATGPVAQASASCPWPQQPPMLDKLGGHDGILSGRLLHDFPEAQQRALLALGLNHHVNLILHPMQNHWPLHTHMSHPFTKKTSWRLLRLSRIGMQSSTFLMHAERLSSQSQAT